MSSEIVTLKIPPSLAQELNVANQTFMINIIERGLREFKIECALDQYARGRISFGAAAQQANVPQSVLALARFAYARDMQPPFSAETVAEELSSC